MLLLVHIIPILHLLLNLLIHLHKVNDEVEDSGKILIGQGINGLSNTVLISHTIAFFEVYFLLDYGFQRYKDVIFYLHRNDHYIGLDVFN